MSLIAYIDVGITSFFIHTPHFQLMTASFVTPWQIKQMKCLPLDLSVGLATVILIIHLHVTFGMHVKQANTWIWSSGTYLWCLLIPWVFRGLTWSRGLSFIFLPGCYLFLLKQIVPSKSQPWWNRRVMSNQFIQNFCLHPSCLTLEFKAHLGSCQCQTWSS